MTTKDSTRNEITPDDLARAERISELMAVGRIRQVDISESIGASRSTVSKWISGENTPAGNYLRLLARKLKTSPEWILYGEAAPTESVHDRDDADDYARHQIELDRDLFMGDLGLNPTIEYDIEYLRDRFVDAKDEELESSIDDLNYLMHKEHKHAGARRSKKSFAAPVYGVLNINGREILRKSEYNISIDHDVPHHARATPSKTFVWFSQDHAMTNRINYGAQCLIDVDHREIKNGKTYMVQHGVLIIIRQLYKQADGGVLLRAANADYDDVILSRAEMSEFAVIGWLYSYTNNDEW